MLADLHHHPKDAVGVIKGRTLRFRQGMGSELLQETRHVPRAQWEQDKPITQQYYCRCPLAILPIIPTPAPPRSPQIRQDKSPDQEEKKRMLFHAQNLDNISRRTYTRSRWRFLHDAAPILTDLSFTLHMVDATNIECMTSSPKLRRR